MKQKEFLIIVISVFSLTLLWVIFNIYHNRATSTITDPLNFQIIPIEGKFDKESIRKIKERNRVNPFFETINKPIDVASPDINVQADSSSSSSSELDSQTDSTTQDKTNSLNQ